MTEEPVTPEPEDDQSDFDGDEESDFDGCDVKIEEMTPDEELPESEGGVA